MILVLRSDDALYGTDTASEFHNRLGAHVVNAFEPGKRIKIKLEAVAIDPTDDDLFPRWKPFEIFVSFGVGRELFDTQNQGPSTHMGVYSLLAGPYGAEIECASPGMLDEIKVSIVDMTTDAPVVGLDHSIIVMSVRPVESKIVF